MGTVSFYLERPGKSGYSLITMKKRYPGYKFLYSTGERILAKDWNDKRQRAKRDNIMCKDQKDATLNSKLDHYESVLNKAYGGLTDKKVDQPSIAELKAEFEWLLSGEKHITAPTLLGLFEMFIEGKIKYKGTDRASNTIKSYKTTKKSLENFSKKYKYPIDYNRITIAFHSRYCDYLKDQGLGLNSIGKHIKNIKSVMNEGLDCDYHNSRDFQKKKFAKPSEQSEEIALKYEEVLKIHRLDLSHNKAHEEIRDIFVVLCRTALRFGDYSSLEAYNIYQTASNEWRIKTIQAKTKEPVIIPLCPLVLEIMERYKNRTPSLPPPKNNQYFNRTIKKILKDAGFAQTGRSLKQPEIPLHDLVSAHTGRRSFVSWAIQSGEIDINTIMKITGHKSAAVFKKYCIQSAEDAADKMGKAIEKLRSVNALKIAQ